MNTFEYRSKYICIFRLSFPEDALRTALRGRKEAPQRPKRCVQDPTFLMYGGGPAIHQTWGALGEPSGSPRGALGEPRGSPGGAPGEPRVPGELRGDPGSTYVELGCALQSVRAVEMRMKSC